MGGERSELEGAGRAGSTAGMQRRGNLIAGTASCLIEVDYVDELYAEMLAAAVLHPGDLGSAVDTDWVHPRVRRAVPRRQLADLLPAPALTRLVCRCPSRCRGSAADGASPLRMT